MINAIMAGIQFVGQAASTTSKIISNKKTYYANKKYNEFEAVRPTAHYSKVYQ